MEESFNKMDLSGKLIIKVIPTISIWLSSLNGKGACVLGIGVRIIPNISSLLIKYCFG